MLGTGPDVLEYGALKKEGVLSDDGYLLPQRLDGHVGDRLTVDFDAAGIRHAQPLEKGKNRRLAAARMADQRCHLAGRDGQVHSFDDGLVLYVSERNIADGNRAAFDAKLRPARRLVFTRGRIEQGVHHPHSDRGGRELQLNARKPAARVGAHQKRRDEREKLSRTFVMIEISPAGIENNRSNRAAADRLHQRVNPGLDFQHLIG